MKYIVTDFVSWKWWFDATVSKELYDWCQTRYIKIIQLNYDS